MDCMRDIFAEGVVLGGRFTTISPLNHGSFGMVFMAKDNDTDELVAVKCLTKHAAATGACPNALAVDERSEERDCHTRLGSHPNLVNMLHHFESDAHTYLVLEYCSMGDLYEAIRLARGPLKTDHVREFMMQMVDAIEFMHAKGIYHRDIKPENIFLTQDGNMKLGDFGLATTEHWSTESTVGSDRYMAPEQYDPAGVGYAPAQADVWAVGICLLNILFARNPFVVPTERDPLFADFVRDRQSLFDVFPTMSQDTFEVIMHAMSLDPKKRSLAAIRQALARVVSFTTDDETLDDFCTEDRGEVVPASANREPLRTPSISSPHVDQGGSFPWAKALQQTSPKATRQLSAIADVGPAAEAAHAPDVESDREDWYSARGTPFGSVLGSTLGASIPSAAVTDVKKVPRSDPVPIAGSLPIAPGRRMPAMASVFGKKDEMVSKSWSDLWDEEEEEVEAEAERRRAVLRERTPTQANVQPTPSQIAANDNKHTQSKPLAVQTSGRSAAFTDVFPGVDENDLYMDDDDDDDDDDDPDHAPPRYSPPPPRYTPPSRRDIMDKWSALGQRRRAYASGKSSPVETTTVGHRPPPSSAPAPGDALPFVGDVKDARRDVGLGVGVTSEKRGFAGVGVWERRGRDARPATGTGKTWEDALPLPSSAPGPAQGDDIGDLEWVGGWEDLHL